MVVFTPDLSERKRILKEVCRNHPQWKVRIGLAIALFIIAAGVLGGFAWLLLTHPLTAYGVFIFILTAIVLGCVPYITALSVKNTAKYKCGFPYTSHANASLLLDEDTLEYVYWLVGPREPAAYSSKHAVYRDENKFVYRINKNDIYSLVVKDDICTIKGNGYTQMPEWLEEDKETSKEFSFIMAFEQRDAAKVITEWRT